MIELAEAPPTPDQEALPGVDLAAVVPCAEDCTEPATWRVRTRCCDEAANLCTAHAEQIRAEQRRILVRAAVGLATAICAACGTQTGAGCVWRQL